MARWDATWLTGLGCASDLNLWCVLGWVRLWARKLAYRVSRARWWTTFWGHTCHFISNSYNVTWWWCWFLCCLWVIVSGVEGVWDAGVHDDIEQWFFKFQMEILRIRLKLHHVITGRAWYCITRFFTTTPIIWADKNSLRCYLESASQTFLTTFSIILPTLINGLPQHSKHDHLFTAITDERRQPPHLWLSTSLPIPAPNPITVQYYSRKKKSPQLVLQIYN